MFGEYYRMAGGYGLDPISMGQMSLWQINQFRRGWINHNTSKTDEEKAREELDQISDDEFFELMAQDDPIGGVQITEEEFIETIKP